MTFFKGLH